MSAPTEALRKSVYKGQSVEVRLFCTTKLREKSGVLFSSAITNYSSEVKGVECLDMK